MVDTSSAEQSTVDITKITTDLNNKINVECPHILSRVKNDLGGITEIWSDGYCVHTGYTIFKSTGTTVTLPTPYIDTNYIIHCATEKLNATAYGEGINITSKAVDNFVAHGFISTKISNEAAWWKTEGYIR